VTGPLAARGVTPREVEVLAQIAAERSNREIAEALHLSVRTVEEHVERLLMTTKLSAAPSGRPLETSCSSARRNTPEWGTTGAPTPRAALVAIEIDYRFDTDNGQRTLAELFDGRSQLLCYHFMFGPNYEAGCPVNSSMADGLDGLLPHLHAHDVTLLLVSQAPLTKLQTYRQRMGWHIPWVSTANTDFNDDFGGSNPEEQVRGWKVDQASLPPIVAQNAAACGTDILGYITQAPAVSAFTLQDGTVYQTYRTAGRGVEFLMPYYPILDRTPRGRDEGDALQTWIRRHGEYV
jgi:predicted dithiol-disulfide oxidoreductase (DUF899 family)